MRVCLIGMASGPSGLTRPRASQIVYSLKLFGIAARPECSTDRTAPREKADAPGDYGEDFIYSTIHGEIFLSIWQRTAHLVG